MRKQEEMSLMETDFRIVFLCVNNKEKQKRKRKILAEVTAIECQRGSSSAIGISVSGPEIKNRHRFIQDDAALRDVT